MARFGMHGEKEPEPKGILKVAARRNSRGLRLYFTIYPDISRNTDNNEYLLLLLAFPEGQY